MRVCGIGVGVGVSGVSVSVKCLVLAVVAQVFERCRTISIIYIDAKRILSSEAGSEWDRDSIFALKTLPCDVEGLKTRLRCHSLSTRVRYGSDIVLWSNILLTRYSQRNRY